ncbi:hypothetical protein S40293_10832 [Stachybotrys chartarum IBT 40293]|nr:hypothetical protein S40293_10832 [Stachybotrys chartarum IBT 40293]
MASGASQDVRREVEHGGHESKTAIQPGGSHWASASMPIPLSAPTPAPAPVVSRQSLKCRGSMIDELRPWRDPGFSSEPQMRQRTIPLEIPVPTRTRRPSYRLGQAQPESRHPCMVGHLGAPSSGHYSKSPEFGSCRVDAGQVDAGAGAGADAGLVGREEASQRDHATGRIRGQARHCSARTIPCQARIISSPLLARHRIL